MSHINKRYKYAWKNLLDALKDPDISLEEYLVSVRAMATELDLQASIAAEDLGKRSLKGVGDDDGFDDR